MSRVTLREYERLYLGGDGVRTGTHSGGRLLISVKHFRRLQAFDERQAGSEGVLIFEWRRDKLWAKHWVGVVQIAGLTIEILPKIEDVNASSDREASAFDSPSGFARRNLLYMLTLAGEVPMHPRDVANVATQKASILDIFIDIFAHRLLDELKRGLNRSYVKRRENLNFLRGKLEFSEHIQQNAVRKDRFFVEYEEYLDDTLLNRILKATCRLLRKAIRRPSTDEKLKNAMMLLADVADVTPTPPDFDRVTFNRTNRRFREVFDFCRLLYLGQSPAASYGRARTYSLLYDMNSLYERFIAEFIRRYVLVGRLDDQLHLDPQSKQIKRHLLWVGPSQKKGPVRLGPDIVVMRRNNGIGASPTNEARCVLIIDTKWKKLGRKKSGKAKGIDGDDYYQLYAYAHRYGAPTNLLLYPQTSKNIDSERFVLPSTADRPEEMRQYVGVVFVRIDRDLARDKEELASELREIVRAAIQKGQSVHAEV